MEVAGPAERAADVAQTLALRLQAAAVGATHRLDARNQPRRLLLQAIEAHAAIIGQALLGRVEHLQQGAALTTLAVVAQGADDILERRQEAADEDELRAQWQRQRRRPCVCSRLPGPQPGCDIWKGAGN